MVGTVPIGDTWTSGRTRFPQDRDWLTRSHALSSLLQGQHEQDR